MSEDVSATRIASTVAAIAGVTGVRPVGWHTRSASSPNTRRLLVEEAVSSTTATPTTMICLTRRRGEAPTRCYALRLRHQRHAVPEHQPFRNAADFADYVLDAFDWLHREGASEPKMMSIGLHLRMIGRPGRIGALDRILGTIKAKGGAWIARRDEIAKHWFKRTAMTA